MSGESKEATEPAATKEPQKRKRKSRWGQKAETAAKDGNSTALVVGGDKSADQGGDGAAKKKRKSRWGNTQKKMSLPPQLAALAASQNLTATQTKMMLLKLQLQEVSTKLLNPAGYIDKEKMSPSPEPTYDSNGKRTNTRDIRFQKKIMADRQKILDEMVKLDPSMAPLVPRSTEWIKLKVPIPVDKYPDYNFIGLIIGPRGNTQKRLQKETGAKIFVRGREPGNRKMNRPHRPEDDEPLHVLITAREQESVDKAEKLIRKLLVPVADHENKHKAMQLRELAAMNGTAIDIVTCRNCGESGHRMYDCPKRQGGAGWKPADVRCSICGADTHPTIDCPNKNDAKQSAKLNSEYSQFMAELGGGTSSDAPSGGGGGTTTPGRSSNTGENDWTCSKCSNSNYSFRTRCNRCGSSRREADVNWKPPPPSNGRGHAPPPNSNEKDPNDWVCEKCGNENYSFRKFCNKCKFPKPGTQQPMGYPPAGYPPQPWNMGGGPPPPYGYGYPPQGGYGMPPQGGYGMPPQGGYPPPQGGYPPSQGGYPPMPPNYGYGYPPGGPPGQHPPPHGGPPPSARDGPPGVGDGPPGVSR